MRRRASCDRRPLTRRFAAPSPRKRGEGQPPSGMPRGHVPFRTVIQPSDTIAGSASRTFVADARSLSVESASAARLRWVVANRQSAVSGLSLPDSSATSTSLEFVCGRSRFDDLSERSDHFFARVRSFGRQLGAQW